MEPRLLIRRRLIAILLLCLSTISQGQIARPKFDALLAFSDNANSFAKNFYKALGSRGNMITSPMSIFTTMSMTSAGAQGQTRSQILRALNLPSEPLTRNSPMAYVLNTFQNQQNDPSSTMEVANFMWVPMGVAVKSDFARTMQDVFQTKVRTADFNRPEEVRTLVNNRVSNATRGKIPQLLPRGAITQQTKVLLANAVYFKGPWLHPFDVDKTKMEPFVYDAVNSKSSIVPMMHHNDTFRGVILDDLDAKAVYLPYENNRFGLLLVLPNRYDGLSNLETNFFKSNYTAINLLQKMIHRNVDLSIPKFQIKFQTDISPVLQRMGITELFSDNADLGGLSSSAFRNRLRASGFFHEATIDVNEGGSEASAASGLEITPLIGGFGYTGPIEFKADHPFLFFLIDEDNANLPIFMGRVTNPTEEIQNNDVEGPQSRESSDIPVNSGILPNRNRFSNGVPKFPNVPSRNFRTNFDEIVFPQTRSEPFLSFHRIFNVPPPSQPVVRRTQFNLNRPFFIDDLFLSPSYQEAQFPGFNPSGDEEESLDISMDRKKRQASSTLPEAVKEGEEEDSIELRGDKFWFKKPQLTELQIPINETKDEDKPASAAAKPERIPPKPERVPLPTTSAPPIAQPQNEVNIFGGAHWTGAQVHPERFDFPPPEFSPFAKVPQRLNLPSAPLVPSNFPSSPVIFPGLAKRIIEVLDSVPLP